MAPHAETPNGLQQTFHFNASNGNNAPTNGSNGRGPQSRRKPNILFIMADQLSAPLLKMHDKDSPIRTPNIDRLAENGVVFDSAYCNSPLCAPSRFSMLAGQLPSKIGAYDNASNLPADTPTFVHMLREAGYETTLSGKMHFVGPDQLHGFENRLTTDIYPADYAWSPDWDDPTVRKSWYHSMTSVYQAGPTVVNNQLAYDDEVFYQSRKWLLEYVRQPPQEQRPFFKLVSFSSPHDPYQVPHKYWDMYNDENITLPKVNISQEDQDPHSKRLQKCIDLWGKTLSEEEVKRARRAYYGSCSYFDEQLGGLLQTLKDCQLADNTIVCFYGDHGDSLGERNLWYKMSFFEHSARVPLIINYPPLFSPRRVKESVSTMDLGPTLADIVNSDFFTGGGLDFDGRSFYPALIGLPVHDEVFGEYMGEGSESSPLLMIRRGRYKYIYCRIDPPQLFDLAKDPLELTNLAESTDPKLAIISANFRREVVEVRWSNLEEIEKDVLKSQRRRRRINKALLQGKPAHWDFQPTTRASEQYIRSYMDLEELESRATYPPLVPHHGVAGAKGE